MTEEQLTELNETTDTDDLPVEDELTSLKARADLMGISYHPSIGVDKLREKVNAQLTAEAENADSDESIPVEDSATEEEETAAQKRYRKKKEAGEQIRVRITCMNPNKREWSGEIFITGNSVVGTYKKYVPYDTIWHVPRIILNQIQERQCQVFYTERDVRGNKMRKGKLIKEFGVEILPQLTEKELKELAQRQAMAAGTAE